jgi:hypothetical protein
VEQNTQKYQIQWQTLIEMIIVLVTILGSTISLYIHTDSKMEAAMEASNARMDKIAESSNARMDKIAERMDATLQGIRE